MKPKLASFRFYAELNDFLDPADRGKALDYRFDGDPAIKDPIETLGVPHSEVDLILVDEISVGFDHRLGDRQRVAVYPVFECLDISPLQQLRAKPLRVTRFVVDVNLGKLARRLRMLGFDTVYGNRLEDGEIVDIARRERRIILTRDRRLLFRKAVSHGYWVRSDDPATQLVEVVERLDLATQSQPLQRCLECNGLIESVSSEQVWSRLQPLTRRYYRKFYRCPDCDKIYWEGSHVDHMEDTIRRTIDPW
ncbi:MAG TPA: Mut7-C RNAse domain-containing protein [Gammaproteobacteria bacterium]|nr:Mut7-C RNAse domain-containing protein [Gammaproteobacteria bacterium]